MSKQPNTPINPPGIFADRQEPTTATHKKKPQVFPTLGPRVRAQDSLPKQLTGSQGKVTLIHSAADHEEVVPSGSGDLTYYHPIFDKHILFNPGAEAEKDKEEKGKGVGGKLKKVIKSLKPQGDKDKSSLSISKPKLERKF